MVSAAILSVGPTSGTFTVGSTFDVSFFLNTEKDPVNALDITAVFPPEKLQLVSPTAGKSIIGLWTAQPTFSNRTGNIYLQGVIPDGINVESGLVITLTFRVKATGSAVVKILNTSEVLSHDGTGSDVLKDTHSGVYQLILPPPAGPIVVSETHPDQSKWYSRGSVILQWNSVALAKGYSYIVNDNPVDVPDNISEGTNNGVVYKSLSSKTHYFHVKALRGGVWGGITHFVLNIDTEPPAAFTIEVLPSSRTTKQQPILEFFTTDAVSGIDHYELKVISLTNPGFTKEVNAATGGDAQPLFIEAKSSYILPPLELGAYNVIVRAYDRAGNFYEATERVKIITPLFKPIGEEGLEIAGIVTITWFWVLLLGVVLTGLLGVGGWYFKRQHNRIHLQRAQKELPEHVQEQLDELQYQVEKGNRPVQHHLLHTLLQQSFL